MSWLLIFLVLILSKIPLKWLRSYPELPLRAESGGITRSWAPSRRIATATGPKRCAGKRAGGLPSGSLVRNFPGPATRGRAGPGPTPIAEDSVREQQEGNQEDVLDFEEVWIFKSCVSGWLCSRHSAVFATQQSHVGCCQSHGKLPRCTCLRSTAGLWSLTADSQQPAVCQFSVVSRRICKLSFLIFSFHFENLFIRLERTVFAVAFITISVREQQFKPWVIHNFNLTGSDRCTRVQILLTQTDLWLSAQSCLALLVH